jgi:hypothetical protein
LPGENELRLEGRKAISPKTTRRTIWKFGSIAFYVEIKKIIIING